ncbi:hypothetical protein BDV95DRAFT_606312 [Massariosphaeria phaeospora]|uniref:Uncharacterized protein n=1 Tax=Massariosphaeria phaeospora TaxID=100035 RepID=A0A7C8IH26_9PLEO|nr:hypothetical protein BDV95DRAFT_606312 [Massariosphaeria phaeospora]
MEFIDQVLDPNGDTAITLTHPTSNFLVWDTGEHNPSVSGVADRHAAGSEENVVPGLTSYLVSSTRLGKHSRYYENIFKPDKWREGSKTEDGYYALTTQDFDPEAFLLFQEILNESQHSLPERVSPEMLAMLAKIVDYHCCQDAVPVRKWYAKWIGWMFGRGKPKRYERDAILWLCIAVVFQDVPEFRRTLKVVLSTCQGWICEPEDVPAGVLHLLQAINDATGDTIEGLLDLLARFRSRDYLCPCVPATSFSCAALMLGSLIKWMDEVGIPIVEGDENPFPRSSVSKICRDLMRAKKVEFSEPGFPPAHRCRLANHISPIAVKLQRKVNELRILKRRFD